MANQEEQNKRPVSNHQKEESDAKKLADEHMADQNHIITDEDMRKIKIGITGEADTPTKQAVKEVDDRIADHKADSDEDTTPGAQKATPWDVIN